MGCLSGDTLAIETDQRTRCTVHPIPTCPLQDTSRWLSKGVLCDVTPRAGGSRLLTPLFSRTATCTEGFGGGGAADDTLLLWNEPVFDHHFQRSSVPQGQSGSLLDGGYLYLRTGLSAAAGRGACAARPPQGGNTPRGGFDGQFSPGTGESVEGTSAQQSLRHSFHVHVSPASIFRKNTVPNLYCVTDLVPRHTRVCVKIKLPPLPRPFVSS